MTQERAASLPREAEPHYIEGVFRLDFRAGTQVCRLECSDFYAHRAQNFCTSCKEMDFVLYLPDKRELWLVELKDYRFNAHPRLGDLIDKLTRKVRDTLFVLQIAASCAPEEQPDEGISLRQMGRLSQQAQRIRIAFGIEMMGNPMAASVLMGIKDRLMRELKFIDPELLCLPITRSSHYAPWRVSPAKGELSTKLRKRLEISQEQQRDQARQARQAKKPASKHHTREKKSLRDSHRALPRWKQRAIERAQGYSGTHHDRAQFLNELLEGANAEQ